MKRIDLKILAWIALPLVLSVTSASALVPPTPFKGIVGLWVVEGQPDAGSGVPPFVNIATAARDGFSLGEGTVVNVDPTAGTAVGNWKYAGGSAYKVRFSGFLAPEVRYVVRATLNVTGDTFTGPFAAEVLDLNGVVLFQYGGTVNGARQGP
jgi:hypothetical protein